MRQGEGGEGGPVSLQLIEATAETHRYAIIVGTTTTVGTVTLAVGDPCADDQVLYTGQVGFIVRPEFRGHRYAEQACRLLLPHARAAGFDALWITCNPDNAASRRTCERLGAQLVDIIPVPPTHELARLMGETSKARYRLPLSH